MEGGGRKPCVFVSSTCYDLSQVRYDIKNFLEINLGYEVLLSEFSSFPLDPNIDAVKNCLRVVNERADLFVLVLGGRYGYITDSGKSVTNLEYLHARAKGIPIYVFVSKSILSILSLWKANPNADFSTAVDSTKILEFVEQIRSHDNVWVFPFEHSHDITNTLQSQFSYLFCDSLLYRKQITTSDFKNSIKRLYGNALRIALEKPIAWEYLLFGVLLHNGIENHNDIRLDYNYNMNIGKIKKLNQIIDIFDWIEEKHSEMLKLIDSLGKIINTALPIAVRPAGEPGNVDEIVYVAENFIKVYKAILEWALEFDAVSADDNFLALLSASRKLSVNIVEDIEQYVERYNKTLNEKLLQPFDENNPLYIDLSWDLRAPMNDEFNIEIENLRKKYNLPL